MQIKSLVFTIHFISLDENQGFSFLEEIKNLKFMKKSSCKFFFSEYTNNITKANGSVAQFG